MSERKVRNRLHKKLELLKRLPPERQKQFAAEFLRDCQREFRRRADDLQAPPAWALVAEARVQAILKVLDQGGDLKLDLYRVCHEAVAAVAGWQMASGSRPVADRERVQHETAGH